MSDEVAPGRLVGERFRLLAPLGEGGAGRVWHAVDESTGGPVAIRFDSERPGPDPAARVVHPHVVCAYVFDAEEDADYSVMELVDGVSLATILDEGPVPDDDALRIAVELCQALHAAHRVGVTHGDLKPSNVLITDEALVKVVGFCGDGGWRQDMYSIGLLLEAMFRRRDPIVNRLLSRDPYTPAQLYQLLTGSTLDDHDDGNCDDGDRDDGFTDDGDGDDRTERRRLVRLAVVASAVTLAVIAVGAWFLTPSVPANLQADSSSGGLPSPRQGQPDQPAATQVTTSNLPAPAPKASTGRNPTDNGNTADNGNRGNDGNSGRPDVVPTTPAVNAVKAVVAEELSTGQILPDAAALLNAKLDDIARFQVRGQIRQADDRVDALKSQLASLLRVNKVTTKGYDEILASLDTL